MGSPGSGGAAGAAGTGTGNAIFGQQAGTVPSNLTITVQPFPISEGEPYNGTVATFTDTNPQDFSSDFEATIDWGDGTPATAGTISQPGGADTPFVVTGAHTYDSPGGYPLVVSIHNVAADTDTLGNVDISRDTNYQATGTIALDPADPRLLFAASNQSVPGAVEASSPPTAPTAARPGRHAPWAPAAEPMATAFRWLKASPKPRSTSSAIST